MSAEAGYRAPLRKVARPRLGDALRRERLFERLDVLGSRPVTWVFAPPGAGKTTLVASYLDARGVGGPWFQCDEGDRDLSTFFFFLREAVLPPGKADAASLPLLTPEYQGDPAGFARRWFRRMFALLPPESVLVLDNYQQASSAALDAVLAVLADEMPDGMRLIVMSRAGPPEMLARPAAHGDVAMLGWDELRMTPGEADALAGSRGLADAPGLAESVARCEGWAAGIALMIDRARGTARGAAGETTGSRETLFGYFSAQAFDELPESARRSLAACSVMPGVTQAQAIALTADPGAAEVLEALFHRGLFTNRRQEREPVFEFHALFSEFLRARAREVLGAAQLQAVMRRAAELLLESGQMSEALALYAELGEWADIERAVVSHAGSLLAQGRARTVLDWIAFLPGHLLDAMPMVRMWQGMALLPTDQRRARAVLTRAYEALDSAGDFAGAVAAASGVVETYFFSYSGYAGLREWTPRLARLLDQPERFVSRAQRLQACSGYLLAALFTDGAHPDLPRRVQELRQLVREPLEPALRLRAGTFLVTYASATLQPGLVVEELDLLDGLAADPTVPAVRQAQWHQRHGALCNDLGDLEQAAQRLARAEALCEANGLRAPLSLIFQTTVFVASARGDDAWASRVLERWRALLSPDRPVEQSQWNFARLVAEPGLDDAQEDLPALSRSLAAQMDATGQTWIRLAGRLPGVHALIDAGDHASAREWIDEMRALVAGTCFERHERDLLIAEAHLALAKDEEEIARERIGRALRVTRTDAVPLRCAQGLRGVRKVLSFAVRAGVEVDEARALAARYGMALDGGEDAARLPPVRINALGRFDVTVSGRRLVPRGKAPQRPLGLLKLLAAHAEAGMPVSQVTACIWPDAEGDRAASTLKVTVHRLRKVLGVEAAIRTVHGALLLDPQWCCTDVGAFEARCRSAQMHLDAGDGDRFTAEAEAALRLYRGELLPAEEAQPWLVAARERLARKARRIVLSLGEHLQAQGQLERASSVYEAAIAIDPLSETLYQRLMASQIALDRPAEAMHAFRRCREMLSIVLGSEPSADTRALFDRARLLAARRTESVTPG